jgi:hypothetical protein
MSLGRANLTQNQLVITAGESELIIDRRTESLSSHRSPGSPITSFAFEFILGCHHVDSKKYLTFATSVTPLTSFWDIAYVASFGVLQLTPGPTDHPIESLLHNGLSLCRLHYSTSRNLTLTLQQSLQGAPNRPHFTWNSAPLTKLHCLCDRALDFLSRPVVAGFVGFFATPSYDFLLISRRCPIRAGARFWVRGSDSSGHVANCIESEQVLSTRSGSIFSHVQLRGSVPLVWSQFPDLVPVPRAVLGDAAACAQAAALHFAQLGREFGSIIALCLTNGHGWEGTLTDTYGRLTSGLPGVTFRHWDFHAECRHTRLDRAERLVELLRDEIDAAGFTRTVGGEVVGTQDGIIRCNCIDCLDRSSIVQFMIARYSFGTWLQEIGEADGMAQFRGIWSDSANAAALQYAGSPALRTDFTRTGKRTAKGVLLDATYGFHRYWANNVTDGNKQDAYDAVTQSVPCGKYRKGNGPFLIIGTALYLLIVFCVTALTRGKQAAREKVWTQRLNAVNRPSFRDAEFRAEQGIK